MTFVTTIILFASPFLLCSYYSHSTGSICWKAVEPCASPKEGFSATRRRYFPHQRKCEEPCESHLLCNF
jgi:hypothetical protein